MCLLLGAFALTPLSHAIDVILTGGVALRSWEHLRGPIAHDNWWANFVRAGTLRMEILRRKDPNATITWIVYRPSYVARGREDGKPYVQNIQELSVKYNAKLVWVDTADQAISAINNAPRNGRRIKSFTYFGHSNAHAFMLDYSANVIGASTQWIHERNLAGRLNPAAFAPNAECRSFGCYTGNSMSKYWRRAAGVGLWGNTEATRYQPLSFGSMPMGNGRWVN